LRNLLVARNVGGMRLLCLYDIHGNVEALDAVLADPRAAGPDAVLVGGDVVPGAFAADTLDRLEALAAPVHWVRGNGEREVAEAVGAAPPAPDDPAGVTAARSAAELGDERARALGELPIVVEAGGVLFCHASPRRDDERGLHVGQDLGPALGWRDPGDYLLVAARGGVTEEHAVDHDAHWQLAQLAGALGAELPRGECRHLGGITLRGPRRVDRRRRLALAVAAHPVHVPAQRLQTVKNIASKRAGHDVAADHNRVGARRPRIGQHRLKCVRVAVDVI